MNDINFSYLGRVSNGMRLPHHLEMARQAMAPFVPAKRCRQCGRVATLGNAVTRPCEDTAIDISHATLSIPHVCRLIRLANEASERSLQQPACQGQPSRDIVEILCDLIGKARAFVHLEGYGGSPDWRICDALFNAAQNDVDVLAGLNAVSQEQYDEFVERYGDRLRIHDDRLRIHATKEEAECGSGSHAKLMVIDGIVALGGSCNFTYTGCVRANNGKELIANHNGAREVRRLNNRGFVPRWQQWDPQAANAFSQNRETNLETGDRPPVAHRNTPPRTASSHQTPHVF